ncbi:hypothetical protein TraAM80_04768 [Trypanosoma rangeli]|uniref:Transmembrane protein n=1 Tax=Trypanosoma rangeli TaxID=5698 RepID=A0A422NHU2_TRYRA|nr:uncharacterized protein TraAM80_04768 [Trypanosoma rangeli]RNF05048.1 hypothetical protein TraAM80_04768 [Trypanosoma rangeli]|eukprot:RNF05048.1 hypothetical protein TraAM80_04768 [Trypanosoma rangeli]
MNLVEDEVMDQLIVHAALPESDEELDEEFHEQVRGYRLVPAILPDEKESVLEAISSLKQKLNATFSGVYVSPSVVEGITYFITFCAVMWVSLGIIPEVMRLTATFAWNFFDGSFYCNAALKNIMQLSSESDGTFQMRYAMVMLFVDALGSSRLVSWSALYVRLSLSLWILSWLLKHIRRLWRRQVLHLMLSYFSGILKLVALIYCAFLTMCFVTTVLCLDFVMVETSFASNDYDRAWRLATESTKNKMPRPMFSTNPTEVDTTVSSVTILKALRVLSWNTENDTCGNFGDVHMKHMNTGNTNIISGVSNGSAWVVEGDDPLLFPLFVSTVIVSKVDSMSIVETGYIIGYFAFFAFYLLRFLMQIFFKERWLGWSTLYRMLRRSMFEVILSYNTKAFLLVYGELLAYSVLFSYVLLRFSLALIRAVLPSAVPIVLLPNTNVPPFISWARLLYLSNTTIQDALRWMCKLLTLTFEKVFNIKKEMHGAPFSLPRLILSVAYVLASVVFSWMLTVVALAAYAIPGIYALGNRGSMLRILFLTDSHFHIILLGARTLNQLEALPIWLSHLWLQPRRFLEMWKQRWWFGSCLGLWLVSSVAREEGLIGYNVQSIQNFPDDVASKFASAIDDISAHIEVYKQVKGPAHSIERLQKTLKALKSQSGVTYFLPEDHVRLLRECMTPPTIQECLCYFLNSVVLFLLLPFLAGTVWRVMVRRFFNEPYCNVNTRFFFIVFSWHCGMWMTVLVSLLSVKICGGPSRVVLYFFCGSQHFTLKSTMKFLWKPHFMLIASITFVPYTLHNLLQGFSGSGGREETDGRYHLYYAALTVLLCTASFFLEMWEIKQPRQTQLRVAHERKEERLVVSRTTPDHVRTIVVDKYMGASMRVEAAVLLERDVGVGAPQRIQPMQHPVRETIANIKAFLESVFASTVQFLGTVAEKESLVEVVFVDHHSISSGDLPNA